MKLRVSNNYMMPEWIEADTIDELKASIMATFSLTAEDLSQQRLLVRDDRYLMLDCSPITGCVDLLQLDEGSCLDRDDLCKDCDTLVLGWKGPFTVRLVTDVFLEKVHNIEVVDNSFTLRQLKDEIERLTGDPVTQDNLPEVLFNGDNEKPLLFFGYYRYSKRDWFPFDIYRNRDNLEMDEGGSPIARLVTCPTNPNCRGGYIGQHPLDLWKSLSVEILGDDGIPCLLPMTEFFVHNSEGYTEEDPKKTFKFKEKKKKKKNQKKRKINNNNNKARIGMEGDKDEASSYVVGNESPSFNKEIMKHKNIL